MTTRWQDVAGDDHVAGYDTRVEQRLAEVAAAGGSPHAEADLVGRLVPPGARVLDAGCGTGRVAWRLAATGLRVVGVDSDARMLAQAASRSPGSVETPPAWVAADLTAYQGESVDLVLLAGNVVPLLAQGTVAATLVNLARHLRPGGLVVSGYGLDEEHLPPGCPVTPLSETGPAYRQAGLDLRARWGTWERGPFTGDYVVDVHQLGRAGPRRGLSR